MKRPFTSRWIAAAGLLIVAAMFYIGSIAIVSADDSKPAEKQTDTKANTSKSKKAPAKKLSGAELYALNCNRCHPERYPTEFNSAQWKTLMTHMRVRANLPASQAKAILKYLQEESGN
jgi:cytochrome c5